MPLRRWSAALLAAMITGLLVGSPATAPRAQAQFYIPCPSIPCPTFDGSNFIKNTATEMHTLQTMYDTAVMKLQQLQQLQRMLADHRITWDSAYQDITADLQSLKSIMSQNSQVCQQITLSNTYFQSNNGGFSVPDPCSAPTVAAARAEITKTYAVVQQVQRNMQKRSAQASTLAGNANRNGMSSGQQLGNVASLQAATINEIQQEEVLMSQNMNAQAHYYNVEIARQQKADEQASAARRYYNYWLHGKNTDPEASPSPQPRPR